MTQPLTQVVKPILHCLPSLHVSQPWSHEHRWLQLPLSGVVGFSVDDGGVGVFVDVVDVEVVVVVVVVLIAVVVVVSLVVGVALVVVVFAVVVVVLDEVVVVVVLVVVVLVVVVLVVVVSGQL